MVDFTDDIEQCLVVLKKGGIILYPTDTVWGIGCDGSVEKAVEKISRLKKRNDEKSMIVLVADEREVLEHVATADFRLFDHLKHVTKPTTVIYEGAIGFANNLVAKDGSIGIRICREKFCKNLLKRFRKPIVSTSANISGSPAPAIFEQVSEEIKQGVDYIVKYRQEDESIASPSSVIRWNKDGSITVLRS